MQDGETAILGFPPFSIAVRRTDGQILLSGTTEQKERYLQFWTPRFQPASADALALLVASWPEISGPFSSTGHHEGRFNISKLVEGASHEIILDREGVHASLHSRGDRVDLDVHSVVAVEVLLGLGDMLAEETQDISLKASWEEARAATDLLPMRDDLEDPSAAYLNSEADWYAGKMGQTPSSYKAAARWLYARQILFGIRREGYDVPYSEWRASSLPDGLPPIEVVDQMVTRAAEALGVDIDRFDRDAIYNRNIDARQEAVYRRWYPPHPERSPARP